MEHEPRKRRIPDNALPVTRRIMGKIYDLEKQQPELPNKTDYGHYLLNFAEGLGAAASNELGWSTERQKEHLRDCALEIVQKYGPKMLDGFLAPELMEVLTAEDIKRIKSATVSEE